MSSTYAYIVTSDANYLQFVNALLNSLDYHGNDLPVYFLAFDVEDMGDYPERVKKAFRFPVVTVPTKKEDVDKELEVFDKNLPTPISRNHLIKSVRMKHLLDIGTRLDAVCLLDADMLVTHPMFGKFLPMVAGTRMAVGCNEAFKWTIGEDYKFEGQPVFPQPRVLNRFHCSVPLFLDMREWYDVFETYLRVFYGGIKKNRTSGGWTDIGDMFSYNIAVAMKEREQDVILMPSYLYTQVHCSGYLPWCRLHRKGDGFVIVEGKEEVMSLHGRIPLPRWSPGIRRGVEKNMVAHKIDSTEIKRYTTVELDRLFQMVQKEWERMCYGHKLDFRKFKTK